MEYESSKRKTDTANQTLKEEIPIPGTFTSRDIMASKPCAWC